MIVWKIKNGQNEIFYHLKIMLCHFSAIWNGAKYFDDETMSEERPLRKFEVGGVNQRGGGRPVPPISPEPEQVPGSARNMILHQAPSRKSTPTPPPTTTTTHESLPDHHARFLQEPVPMEPDSEVYFLGE